MAAPFGGDAVILQIAIDYQARSDYLDIPTELRRVIPRTSLNLVDPTNARLRDLRHPDHPAACSSTSSSLRRSLGW